MIRVAVKNTTNLSLFYPPTTEMILNEADRSHQVVGWSVGLVVCVKKLLEQTTCTVLLDCSENLVCTVSVVVLISFSCWSPPNL